MTVSPNCNMNFTPLPKQLYLLLTPQFHFTLQKCMSGDYFILLTAKSTGEHISECSKVLICDEFCFIGLITGVFYYL